MLEVIEKDVTKGKLTVTPTRQLLKVPPNTSESDRVRLISFSEMIINEVSPSLLYSLRGQFLTTADGKFCTTMEDNSRKTHITFVEK